MQADFDIAELQHSLLQGSAAEGAIATFTGYVRSDPLSGEVSAMELEHYPGMTEKSIHAILHQSAERWPILSASVVHRVGRLLPGEQIVWVGVASAHRAAAFASMFARPAETSLPDCEIRKVDIPIVVIVNERTFWKAER